MNHVYFLYTNILWNNGCLQNKNIEKFAYDSENATIIDDFHRSPNELRSNEVPLWFAYNTSTQNSPITSSYGIAMRIYLFSWAFWLAFDINGGVYTKRKINENEWTDWKEL